MSWWTESKTQIKQKHRFFVTIASGLVLTSVKTVTQPSVSFDNKTYKMLNHEFKYPGIAKWNDVSIKLVDPDGSGERGRHSTVGFLMQMINNTGYAVPYTNFSDLIGKVKSGKHAIDYAGDTIRELTTPEKSSTIANSFGGGLVGQADFGPAKQVSQNLSIWQISPDGKITEGWTLANPLVKDVKFGDLAYDSSDAVEYELVVQYDFAIHRKDELGKVFRYSALDINF